MDNQPISEKVTKRDVKFHYYEVHITHAGKDAFFNLAQWANTLPDGNTNDGRNVVSSGDTIRCDKTESVNSGVNQFDWFHFTKLRDSNVPAVATLNDAELNDITLKPNEFIAEDVTMLFDETNYVAMIQKNIFSLSVGAIQNYINYFWNNDKSDNEEDFIELRPIYEKETFEKAKSGKGFTSLELNTADRLHDDGKWNGALEGIFKSLGVLGGLHLQVKITVGRQRKKKLSQTEVLKALEQIEEYKNDFNSASVKADIGGRNQLVSLIESNMCSTLPFSLPARSALLPDAVQTAMQAEYFPNEKNKMHYIQTHKM